MTYALLSRASGIRWLTASCALLTVSAELSLWNNAQADTTASGASSQITTKVEAETELTFAGRRGVGGIKTFQFPKRRLDDPTRFVNDPYVPKWQYEMLRGRLDEIQRAGFDFLRLNVNPSPMFAEGSPALEKRLSEINFAISSSLQSGLKVVLDVHVSERHPVWGAPQVTKGTQQPAFRRYLEVLTALAGLVSDYDPKLVALEVFNEPPPPCDWPDRPSWPEQLNIIYELVRSVAPRHTLIFSGACWASIDGLLLLDGSKFDSNTMFTVHYYEPQTFAHQGYWNGSQKFMQYVAPIPYPPEPAQLPATLARVEQAIGKARNIDPTERPYQWQRAKKRISRYFTKFRGREFILARFAKIRAWADRHAISPQRILIGEFGAMKDIYGYRGAEPADRARWLSDVREAAETHGFAWSVWALTNTMGIVTGATRGPLDQNVLDALGLVSK